MDAFQKHKGDLEKEIIENSLRAYEQGEFSRDDLKTVADLVITELQQTKDEAEILNFLNTLATKWPFLSNVAIIEKGTVKEEEEKAVYAQALDMVHNGQIDNAIQLAKTETN
jgi:hypothetical protein